MPNFFYDQKRPYFYHWKSFSFFLIVGRGGGEEEGYARWNKLTMHVNVTYVASVDTQEEIKEDS
jgi:hypothetical protein